MQEEPATELTPREQKRQEHAQKTQERANEAKRLQAEYRKIAASEAFQDLQAKLRSFSDYHAKVAKDGVGFEVDSEGKERVVRLTPEERVSEMDKASGVEEIIAYVDRKLIIESSKESK